VLTQVRNSCEISWHYRATFAMRSPSCSKCSHVVESPVSRIFLKMAQLIITVFAGLIVIIFYVYLVLTFLSFASLILNLIIITALYFLIRKDLKDNNNHKYYIFSLIPTALFFIFSGTGIISNLIKFTETLLLSLVTVAALLVYLLAHTIVFVYEYNQHSRQKRKK